MFSTSCERHTPDIHSHFPSALARATSARGMCASDFGEAIEAVVAHQLANLDEKCPLVDLVRQLVDDDGLAVALFQLLDVGPGADYHAAAASAIPLLDSRGAVDDSAGRKVRSRDDFHQLVD